MSARMNVLRVLRRFHEVMPLAGDTVQWEVCFYASTRDVSDVESSAHQHDMLQLFGTTSNERAVP